MIDVTLLRKYLDSHKYQYVYNYYKFLGIYCKFGLLTEFANLTPNNEFFMDIQYANNKRKLYAKKLKEYLKKKEFDSTWSPDTINLGTYLLRDD